MGITVHPLLTVMIFFHLLTNALAVFVTLLSQTKKNTFWESSNSYIPPKSRKFIFAWIHWHLSFINLAHELE